jgi:hypothetical protein
MRKIFLLLFVLALCGAGCKKDEVRAVLHSPDAIKGFTASSTQVVLSAANDSAIVTSLSWQAVDYGYSSSVTYSLLLDVPSDTGGADGWKNATRVNIATDSLHKSWLGTDLNRMINLMGLDPGVAGTIVVRLKSDVNQSTGVASTVPGLYSDIVLTITPYKVVLIYPKLYVAADFLVPSWTQLDQPGWILASPKDDKVYEGYVYFPYADQKFKLSTQLDWNGTNYGVVTGNTISGTGGDMHVPGPAYVRIIADLKEMTISFASHKWYLPGDFNGWSTSATPLTFDPATSLWTATGVSMTAGDKFKFLGDTDWGFVFGLDSKGDLVFNGGDVVAAKTGTFTVTLDLSQGAGNYTYSVK